MVHDHCNWQEARGLKKNAREMTSESKALEGIEDAEFLAVGKMALVVRLREEAESSRPRQGRKISP